MTITLDFSTLYDKVSRSLSIIGKRAVDDKGNRLYSDITVGTNEKAIITDFFDSAFVDLCAELNKFITAEVSEVHGFSANAVVSFWTDQAASGYVNQVTADGQYLYNYSTFKLYIASLSFPFSSQSPASGTLFTYGANYYSYSSGLTQLTAEQVELLTDEQKAAAIPLTYYNVDPSTITETRADVYAYYNSTIYKTSRNCSFSETTPSATTVYYDPVGMAYQWLYGAMQRIPGGLEGAYTLTLTTPDNWNSALTLSLQKGLYEYCVAYTLYSWFIITSPGISQKYAGDCNKLLGDIIRLIYEKKAPASASPSPLDVDSQVTTNT